MQIYSLSANNIKNYPINKTQRCLDKNQKSRRQGLYSVGTLDALAFKGNGVYDDMQMCKNMLEASTILVPGELKQRFNLEKRNLILAQLRRFDTDAPKSSILMPLLSIKHFDKASGELSHNDIIKFLKLMSGRNKEEQMVVIDVLESEIRNKLLDDEDDMDQIIFKPIEDNPQFLKTLAKMKNEIDKNGHSVQFRNDVLDWVFAFIQSEEKPYVEKASSLIVQKLIDSNLELGLTIDHVIDYCDEDNFNKILPLLTIENKDEILNNDDFISSLKWRREEAAENFIEKYSN